MLGLVVGDEPLLARPVADGVPDRVAEIGREPALLDLEHLVPAAGLVKAERRAGRRLRERVLELVPVEERRCGGENRIERRLGDAADPLERVSNLVFLRRRLHRVVEILEAATAAGRVVRARCLDALRRRDRAPRSRAPLRTRASPSSHARARDRPAARAGRRRRSRSDARRRCRRRRASRPGARAPRASSPARPSPQGTYVMSRRRFARRRGADSRDPADERDGDAAASTRSGCSAAGAAGSIERAEREIRRPRRRRRAGPQRPTSRFSTTKIQTSVPTSAATWLCTIAPIATPISARQHDASRTCWPTRQRSRRR